VYQTPPRLPKRRIHPIELWKIRWTEEICNHGLQHSAEIVVWNRQVLITQLVTLECCRLGQFAVSAFFMGL
jgi:hypothetical protein